MICRWLSFSIPFSVLSPGNPQLPVFFLVNAGARGGGGGFEELRSLLWGHLPGPLGFRVIAKTKY